MVSFIVEMTLILHFHKLVIYDYPREGQYPCFNGIVIPGVYNIVVKRLSMKDPIVVGLSPNCDNIKYILPSALQ